MDDKNRSELNNGILDSLITITGSWKIIIGGIVISGVIASAALLVMNKKNQATAIVKIAEDELIIFHATPLLDFVAKNNTINIEGLDEKRSYIKKSINYSFDRKSKAAILIVSASSPDEAVKFTDDVIRGFISMTQLKGAEKDLIEKKIKINNESIAETQDVVDNLIKGIYKYDHIQKEEIIKNLTVLKQHVHALKLENAQLENKLMPRGDEIYIQNPTLLEKSNRSVIFISLVMLVSGFFLTGFVFVREWFLRGFNDKDNREKFEIMRKNLSR